MYQNKGLSTKGFTLIELLVVIAVIGILASVIMSSTSVSRAKAYDGKIKEQMLIIRSQAEIFYNNNASSYAGVCTVAGGVTTQLAAAHSAAGVTGGIVTTGTVQNATTTNCFADASGYAVSVKLRVPSTTTYLCVDSRNQTLTTTTPLAANTNFCS